MRLCFLGVSVISYGIHPTIPIHNFLPCRASSSATIVLLLPSCIFDTPALFLMTAALLRSRSAASPSYTRDIFSEDVFNEFSSLCRGVSQVYWVKQIPYIMEEIERESKNF